MSDSYTVYDSAGTFHYENADATGEMFVHQQFGALNITKAWRLLNSVPGLKPRELPITPELIEHLHHADIEQKKLKAITPERLNDPVLFFMDEQGKAYLIDGVHRMHLRIRRKLKTVSAHLVSFEFLKEIQITCWKLAPDGSRTLYDLRAHLPERET